MAMRRRSPGESAAAWKQEMMSIGSPVRESVPGRIEPSDMMTAGTLCSRIAASVPTGGLSQATTGALGVSPSPALENETTGVRRHPEVAGQQPRSRQDGQYT